MKLYNSISKKIEEFIPINPNEVTMYFCGPTTYNYAHIGNARPAVIADLLFNVLTETGYNVKYASNYTDIDDRIVAKALEQNKDALEISQFYIDAYVKDLKSLNVKKPQFTPKVSDTMDKIIHFIEQLIAKGYAYEIGGDVYFDIDKVENYGIISHQKKEELIVGSRVEENSDKRNPMDFALWKKTTAGKNWTSPFSSGRPGWHSECVVMIQDVFKSNLIDIHGGGSDLKFPHHENEVVQCSALHNTTLANYWVHNGMIKVDGAKMSKSLGNVLFISDLVEKYGGNQMRWFILSSPYRLELILNEETLNNAVNEFNKVQTARRQLKVKLRLSKVEKNNILDELYSKFLNELQNDLNVASANTVIFELIKKINQELRKKEFDISLLQSYECTLDKMLFVLGYEMEEIELDEVDFELFKAWENAKANKEFEVADLLRNRLIQRGRL